MAYFESILLGISLAAIPGPIFFEVLRRTLTRGFWSGALLSVGEFLANFAIMLLTFFGVYQFLLFKPVKIALFLIGSAILIWIGVSAWKMGLKDIKKKASAGAVSSRSSIAVGFGLAMASPLAVAVWISVGGAYLARYSTSLAVLVNIFLLAFGVMLFFFALAALINFTRHRISPKYIMWFSRIFGTVLVGYGLYFLYLLFGILF